MINDELRKLFGKLDANQRRELIKSLSPNEIDAIYQIPELFLYDKQIAPPGNWRYHLFMAGRGAGKMLDLNTEVPTPNGFIKLSELKINDTLYDENGNECKVLQLHPIDKNPISYQITFSDATIVNACKDHLWKTWTKTARKAKQRSKNPTIHPQIRTTEEILNTLYIKAKKQEINHSIPVCKPIQYKKKQLPIDPYVLGCWLGDGQTNSGRIECADEEILTNIKTAGYEIIKGKRQSYNKSKSSSYAIGEIINCPRKIRRLTKELNDLNLLDNKHIPDIYLYASIDQRLALLQGLMDTDGCCLKTGAMEYCSVLPKLAEQTLQLMNSLGIKATLNRNESWLYNKRCKDRFRIHLITKLPIFRLKRKLVNIKQGKQDTRNTHRYIVDIKPIDTVPMRCITVDSQSHQFLITRSYITTHNTIASTAWLYSKILKGAKEVAIVGPDYSTLVKEIQPAFEANFPPNKKPHYNGQHHFYKTDDGCMIKLYTSDQEIRGCNPEYAVVEEIAKWCDQIPEKIQERFDIFDLSVRKGKNPQIFISSTPKPFPWFVNFVKEIELNNPLYSITKGTTFDNIFLSDAAKGAYQNKFKTGRTGLQELYAELLLDTPGALWKQELIDKHRLTIKEYKQKIQNGEIEIIRIVIGIDPSVTDGKNSDETGIIIAMLSATGEVYILDDYSGVMSPDAWGKRAIEAYRDYQADRIIAEQNNGGKLVEINIKRLDRYVPINLVHASKGKIARAEPVAGLMEDNQLFMVGDYPELEKQMTSFTGDTKQKSPDRLDAMVYAVTELVFEQNHANRSFDNMGSF